MITAISDAGQLPRASFDQTTQHYAALVEQSAAAAVSLLQQVQQLVEAVRVSRLYAH